jgi:hypothetical protein
VVSQLSDRALLLRRHYGLGLPLLRRRFLAQLLCSERRLHPRVSIVQRGDVAALHTAIVEPEAERVLPEWPLLLVEVVGYGNAIHMVHVPGKCARAVLATATQPGRWRDLLLAHDPVLRRLLR